MVWTTALAGYHLLDPNSHPLPVFSAPGQANLSNSARAWLGALGLPNPDSDPAIARLPWEHALAIGYAATLGEKTCDVFLNNAAFWRNIPETIWNFNIGGYQVIKKFLSYREHALLGRALTPAEIRYVRDMARRLAALRLMAPELDANYRACAAAHHPLTPHTGSA